MKIYSSITITLFCLCLGLLIIALISCENPEHGIKSGDQLDTFIITIRGIETHILKGNDTVTFMQCVKSKSNNRKLILEEFELETSTRNKDTLKDGFFKSFYSNGSLKEHGYYTLGIKDGVFTKYTKDSTLIAQDKYVNVLGKEILTAWNKFDENGAKIKEKSFWYDVELNRNENLYDSSWFVSVSIDSLHFIEGLEIYMGELGLTDDSCNSNDLNMYQLSSCVDTIVDYKILDDSSEVKVVSGFIRHKKRKLFFGSYY